MRVFAITVAFVALALDACTSYAPPAREPQASVQRFESRRLDDPFLVARIAGDRAASPFEWNLDALARAAIYLSPDLDAARAKWRVSRAAIVTAGRRPDPSLDASVGRATNAPAGDPAGLADVALGIRIETAGKRGHRIAQADALSESDRLDLHAAAWQVRGRIRDAMLDWDAAARQISVLDRQIDVDRSIARMLGTRVELGEAAMGEKVRADATLSRALLDRAAAEGRVADARSRLAQAVGVPVPALDAVHVMFEGLQPGAARSGRDAAELGRAALGRDDVRAALARFQAADAAYRLELARQYPDIELGPSYSYDTGTNKISIGVMRLSLPLADRNQGPIAEARARRDESAVRVEALQASVIAELDRAHAGERDARERSALAQALLDRERGQLAATSRRFTAGEDDRLALASAQAAVHDAEKAALAARLALQKSIGRIEDAVHTPLFGASGAPADSVIEKGGSR